MPIDTTPSTECCSACGQTLIVCPRMKILNSLPERGYLRQKLLIPHVVPFSAATLWRKVKSGDFPAPVKLTPRVTAWRTSDVTKWLREHEIR